MEHFIDQVHERWGGGEGWFRHAGADPSTINRWRDLILDRA